MEGLTPGRMVHYVSPTGAHLAAVVTKVWNEMGTVNLNVQMAGDGVDGGYEGPPVERKTSITYDDSPGTPDDGWVPSTWHWIEKA